MNLDLKALREKWTEHGITDVHEALALIDELTEAWEKKQALDEEEGRRSARIIEFCAEAESMLGEDYSDWRKVNFDSVLVTMKAKLAHARAAAFEEAAQFVLLKVNTGGAHPDAIRALSATPAAVVCMPVETFEATKAALKTGAYVLHWEVAPGNPALVRAADECRAALAEMAKVKP